LIGKVGKGKEDFSGGRKEKKTNSLHLKLCNLDDVCKRYEKIEDIIERIVP